MLDFDLNVLSTEEEVGPFSVDIYAEDDRGHNVVIENQLERTDHDHLGKILTYLLNLDNTKTAVWITSEATPEHREVIERLNEREDISFYLIKIEVIRFSEIESRVAPLFTVVARPTETGRRRGDVREREAKRYKLREGFWTRLLEKANEKMDLYSNVSPSRYGSLSAGAGKSGVHYRFVITYDSAKCGVYLSKSGAKKLNKKRFEQLFRHKEEIEKDFGDPLKWKKGEDINRSKIFIEFEKKGFLEDKDQWIPIQDKMIEAMIRLEKVFRKPIGRLD